MQHRIFHVISNTHWDREWRFPFEQNRQMLVEMMDATIDILLSEPDYRAFHLDSQSVVLHDYLAVRPDRREVISSLVKERRLFIGPWFVLPDEFQVGGENLIRNLLLGHRICAEFGPVMKIGYSPFSWGQISQLPQIYHQFGIEVVMFYRGVNSLDTDKAEFMWEGADGTRVLATRFSTMPRYNFYFYVYRPVIHNEQPSDREYSWRRGGKPFRFADRELSGGDFTLLDPVDDYYKENIRPSVEAIVRDQADDFRTPHVFWAEGHDSSGPNRKTVRLIRDINELVPGVKAVHSTLEEYARGLQESVDPSTLPVVKGERRSSQNDARSTNLYGYTTSARMYLKQKNFEAEKWLQFYAEPFNAIAGLLGMDIRDRYLEMAWYALLENAAHDSIGGCSLDDIHVDMMGRYKKSIEISKGVFGRAAKHIARSIDLSHAPAHAIHLVAFNPTTYERREVVEAFIDVPAELDRGAIEVTTYDGSRCSLQTIGSAPAEPILEQMIDRPMHFKTRRYHCLIDGARVPAFGYTTLHVNPVRKGRGRPSAKVIARMRSGLPILENEYLRVMVQRNGALTIVDKRTSRTFSNIGYFYDEGEGGHAWIHKAVPPYVNTLKSRPAISIAQNGPLRATVSVLHHLTAAASLESRRRKNARRVRLPIELRVTLDGGSRRVGLDVAVNNTAESHRLRMMFPMGIDASHSHAEGQFDVVARAIHRPDTGDWIEQPMYDYPLHHFVDLHDGRAGAAVLVQGLKEYEVLDDKARTVAVTLLRGFRFIVQPSSWQDYSHQKGSQCLGLQHYRMAFYPHEGTWEEAGVYREALTFNNELRLCEIGTTAGRLPADHSFVQVQPANLILSCIKEPEDGARGTFVLRLYNPTDEEIQGRISLAFPVKKATLQTLEERHGTDIRLNSAQGLDLTVPRKRIVTVRLEF